MRAAAKEKRNFIGFEINAKYEPILKKQKGNLLAMIKSSAMLGV
jgi:DNA modification methylase